MHSVNYETLTVNRVSHKIFLTEKKNKNKKTTTLLQTTARIVRFY